MSESKSVNQLVSLNAEIGMDEVVSVFVSEYETNLFDRKDDLSDRLKLVKAALTTLNLSVESKIDTDQYLVEVPVLDLKSTIDKVEVVWELNGRRSAKSPHTTVQIEITDTSNDRGYSNTIHKLVEFPIDQSDVEEYTRLNAELEDLNAQMVEVMMLIKTVSRKERQIRGKISKMKLQEAGYEGLLGDENILQLCQL